MFGNDGAHPPILRIDFLDRAILQDIHPACAQGSCHRLYRQRGLGARVVRGVERAAPSRRAVDYQGFELFAVETAGFQSVTRRERHEAIVVGHFGVVFAQVKTAFTTETDVGFEFVRYLLPQAQAFDDDR